MKMSIKAEDPPLFDLKYFAEYDVDVGFKVSLDGIHNIQKNAFHVAIMSLNPPASMYIDNAVPTSDVRSGFLRNR